MQTSENRIKFTLGNTKLISKVIDGKFPDYKKVVPQKNDKSLILSSNKFTKIAWSIEPKQSEISPFTYHESAENKIRTSSSAV